MRAMVGLLLALVVTPYCLAADEPAGATVTIDMNGFPLATGGQVTGPGFAEPLPMKIGEQPVVLTGLQPGGAYSIDFFHNSGLNGSDFAFTVNAAGTGVESVTLGGEKHQMLLDFKPGDATLKLATFEIVLNANGGQTGPFFVSGLSQPYNEVPPGTPNQKVKAIPGYYSVDNLSNCGNEDNAFIVDSQGGVTACPVQQYDQNGNLTLGRDSSEYVEIDGNKIAPRATFVRFRIEGPKVCNANPSHPSVPKIDGTTAEYELLLPVGNGGVNLWVFNSYTVLRSDATLPDGKPMEGSKGDADFYFYPRLRYDLKTQQYSLESVNGPAASVFAEVSGLEDDNITPLVGVKVTATIVPPAATTEEAAPAAE